MREKEREEKEQKIWREKQSVKIIISALSVLCLSSLSREGLRSREQERRRDVRIYLLMFGSFFARAYASQGLIKVHRDISIDEVTRGKVLGRGAGGIHPRTHPLIHTHIHTSTHTRTHTGVVYEGVWNGAGVAVKVFDENHISFSKEDFTRELALMWYGRTFRLPFFSCHFFFRSLPPSF